MAFRRVLITGGAGFIGSNLALRLVSMGYEVTVLDNLSTQVHGKESNLSPLFASIKDKVNFIIGDVRNRKDWLKSLDKQEVVVHLAAETGTGQSMYEIERYVGVNTGGTSIFLDILANEKHNIEKIVVASSRSIYGEGKYQSPTHGIVYPNVRREDDMTKGDFEVKCPFSGENAICLPTDENAKIHPSSVYGITKQTQEQLFLTVGRSLNIPAVALRYQNVYGPGQSLSNPYTGILSIFSTQIKNSQTLNIFEDGKESRDFVYIDDVVNATILGIERKEADYKVYNVGTGVGMSVLKVAETLRDLYQSDVGIFISGRYRIGDIRHNIADLSAIKEDLGFEPKFSFEKGIRNFVNWVNEQRPEPIQYQKSIEEMHKKGLYK